MTQREKRRQFQTTPHDYTVELFVLNIGNTNTGYGIWRDGVFSNAGKIPTAHIKKLKIPSGIPSAGSSVVPEASRKLADMNIFWLNPGMKSGIDFSGTDISNMGADRLANLVAAANFAVPPPLIVADFGTAITIDFLDNRRKFRGGVIQPGRTMVRKALAQQTAKIPPVPLLENNGPFGKNTEEAVSFGTDIMITGGVKEIIGRMVDKTGYAMADVRIIGIGGDAEFFLSQIPELTFGGDEFTLGGIAKAWEMNCL